MSTPRSSDPLTAGLRVGPYLLLAPLGSGGSSRVWAVARTGQLGFTKRMALKVMRQDKLTSERARQRFDREARLGAQLRHPNLRAVHELGSHEGRPHMALSWVDTSLEELLDHAPNRRLEPEVVCWLGIQACAALAAAHTHVNPAGVPSPIVHGDVSPGNILLTMNGHVLLADLAATPDPSPSATAEQRSTKTFFGSLGYAAPEALKGSPVDGRADLFSLGCVLHEALSGSPAFEADDERSLLFQVLEQGPVDLAVRAPDVPDELVGVVRRALQRGVDERFASAEEMRRALWSCVPTRTSFDLERRSTDLIGRVLGERIRQREEEMRLTFQRFAPSQLERTDTLPIGNATRRTDSPTLRATPSSAPPSTRREARVSDPGGVAATAEPKQARRAFWVALTTLAAAASAYWFWSQQGGQGDASPTSAATAASAALAAQPASRELSREQQELRARRPESSGSLAPTAAAEGHPAAPPATPVAASAGASAADSNAGAGATPAAAQPSRTGRPAPNSKTAPRRATGSPRPQRTNPPVPFEFHPPEDPYAQQKPKLSPLKSAPTR